MPTLRDRLQPLAATLTAAAIAWAALTVGMVSAEPTIGDYRLLDSRRLGPYDFRLEYDARLHNPDGPLNSARATLSSDNPSATIVDGDLNFGPVTAGQSARSTDRFTLIHNRSEALSETDLRWKIETDSVLGTEPPPVEPEPDPQPEPDSPQIISVPDTEVWAGTLYRYQTAATTGDEALPLVYTLSDSPAGMAVDEQSGLVEWTPGDSDLGPHAVTVTATDADSRSDSQSYVLTVLPAEAADDTPQITSYPPASVHPGEGYVYQLAGDGGENLTYELVEGPPGMTLDDDGTLHWEPDTSGDYPITVVIRNADGKRSEQRFTLSVEADPLPSDPIESAPPLGDTGAAFMEDIRFLFEGTSSVQTGLQQDALEENLVAVVRGRVLARNGRPLPGVRVRAADAPQFGSSITRTDGWFDLVLNGASEQTIEYRKPGWLPVQRILKIPAEDYVIAPDVSLTRLDPKATRVRLGDNIRDTQVAQGSLIDDGDGARRATLLIPPGTTASYTRTDGTVQPLSRLTFRATEYTVGTDGPRAMPGELPAASGYTYAVELSADEVLADGVKVAGKDVMFNQPVPVYVDNFIGFPVGGVVPVGYYDNDAARWAASDNGRVIKILGVSDGLAGVDLDGSGIPADAAALEKEGFTDAERERLASTYPAGAELWRFRVTHLSTWDCNWPHGPPIVDPHCPFSSGGSGSGTVRGSEITVATGGMRERIALPGIEQSLVYSSARRASSPIKLLLTGPSPHGNLKRVNYQLSIAGQVITGTTTGEANKTRNLYWNGRDAYNRPLRKGATLHLRLENVYRPIRYTPAELERVFGTYQNMMADPENRVANAISLRSDRANFEVSVITEYTATIGSKRMASPSSTLGDGQLSLSGLPVLDAERGVLIRGDGSTSSGGAVLQSLLGAGRGGSSVPGVPVALANDKAGRPLLATPERLYRIVEGQAEPLPGGDAFENIRRIRSTRSGDLLVLASRKGDSLGRRLWSLSSDGDIRALAGNGQSGCGAPFTQNGESRFGLPLWESGRNIEALTADLHLTDPSDIAISRDGDIYLSDAACHVVYWLRPGSDQVTVVAGNGQDAVHTAEGPAGGRYRQPLGRPLSLALDRQGRLYIGTGHGLVRRLGTDNWIDTLAGTGEIGYQGDGGLAINAQFGPIDELLAGPTGTVYLDDTAANGRLRRIDTQGLVTTIAGDGDTVHTPDSLSADGAAIGRVAGLLLDDKGRLHFGETANGQPGIRRIASAYSAFDWQSDIRIPVDGGRAIQIFDRDGRPLRTEDAATGQAIRTVVYDDEGRLSATVDAHGRQTRYERDADGRISAIVAPNGRRSLIDYDRFGRPDRLTEPDGAEWGLDYDARGLLTRFTDPNGHATRFAYDDQGRLIRDTDAAGGGWRIEHDLDPKAHKVRYTSAEGRIRTYRAETDPDAGRIVSRTRLPHGGATETLSEPVAGRTISTAPNGTETRTERLPSAVPFGAAPDSRTTVTLPSGLEHATESRSRWALADPADATSWVRIEQTTDVNGKAWTETYDPDTRVRTLTSPEGRQTRTSLDRHNRTTRTVTAGHAPLAYGYDDRGNLTEIRQGEGQQARVTILAYDDNDHLRSATDPLGRTTGYVTDGHGRPTRITLPDGRQIHLGHDAKGNLLSLTPPGRDAHAMAYSAVDLETGYTPPVVDDGTGGIESQYNKDRDLTRRRHALGETIDFGYDSAGRLVTRSASEGNWRTEYRPNTSQIASIITPTGERLDHEYDGALPTASQWSGTVNGRVDTEWNADFDIRSHTVNRTHTIDYDYDDDGLLIQAGDLTLERNTDNGQVETVRLGQLTTTRTYSAFGELQSTETTFQGTSLYKAQYAYDKGGKITRKTEIVDGESITYDYGYDRSDRLVEVTENGLTSATWTYDPNGNRIGQNSQSAGTYDAQDRLLGYDLGNQERPFPTQPIGYVIDGENRRIGKTQDGTITQGFLYKDALNPIAELDESENLTSLFVYADKGHVPAYLEKDGSLYRIVSDHLGSPRLIVDSETGSIVQRMDYDVWGRVTEDTHPEFQPFGFAGGIYDRDVGLVRFGARDYDPFSGRWTGKDPILFDGNGPNLYGYVLGDPVNYVDYNGLWPSPVGVGNIIGDAFDGAGIASPIVNSLISSGPSSIAGSVVRIVGGFGTASFSYHLANSLSIGNYVAGGWATPVALAGVAGWEFGKGIDGLYDAYFGYSLSDWYAEYFWNLLNCPSNQ